MPIPEGPERIIFAGDARPLPAPLSRGKIDIGYLRVVYEEVPQGTDTRVERSKYKYIQVTHALVDRTFVYKVLLDIKFGDPNDVDGDKTRRVVAEDVRALFIPTNKLKPNLDQGEWYYGREKVLNFIENTPEPRGILFVDKLATVRWHSDGAGCARELVHIMRPQMSAHDASPVEFRGLYNTDPPECCDM